MIPKRGKAVNIMRLNLLPRILFPVWKGISNSFKNEHDKILIPVSAPSYK